MVEIPKIIVKNGIDNPTQEEIEAQEKEFKKLTDWLQGKK